MDNMSAEGTKVEGAGVNAPVASPKVGGIQGGEQPSDNQNAKLIENIQKENGELRAESAKKDEKITALDAEIKKLKEDLAKKGKGKAEKSEPKYLVVDPFRGNTKKDDGEVYDRGADVSHFDEDRLANLIDRGLVKKS